MRVSPDFGIPSDQAQNRRGLLCLVNQRGVDKRYQLRTGAFSNEILPHINSPTPSVQLQNVNNREYVHKLTHGNMSVQIGAIQDVEPVPPHCDWSHDYKPVS